MPSSHSSSVVALATSVGFETGFSSAEFSIAFVLAFVVMYDACGIRKAAGEQAAILNDLIPICLKTASNLKIFEPFLVILFPRYSSGHFLELQFQ